MPDVFNHRVVAADKVHLTAKPLPLLVDPLGGTPDGGTILDPFIGGGAALLACLETGRPCIGIERAVEYFGLAGARIRRLGETRQTGERQGRS